MIYYLPTTSPLKEEVTIGEEFPILNAKKAERARRKQRKHIVFTGLGFLDVVMLMILCYYVFTGFPTFGPGRAMAWFCTIGLIIRSRLWMQ